MHSFHLTPDTISKPYALMDLDDTLFQTLRKLSPDQRGDDALTVATLDKRGQPLSLMTAKQTRFFNWLYHSCELIPVTARDTAEITRVLLPFNSWRILTHGAVMVAPDGTFEPTWQAYLASVLQPLQRPLTAIGEYLQTADFSQLRVTPHYERFGDDDLCVYIAVKHVTKDAAALQALATRLPTLLGIADFAENWYIHHNANNLAILPKAVHKRHAVAFLQTTHLDSTRPCFGFGDSLADVDFLRLLDWYGTPARGQLHGQIGAWLAHTFTRT